MDDKFKIGDIFQGPDGEIGYIISFDEKDRDYINFIVIRNAFDLAELSMPFAKDSLYAENANVIGHSDDIEAVKLLYGR